MRFSPAGREKSYSYRLLLPSLASSVSCWVLVKNARDPSVEAPWNSASLGDEPRHAALLQLDGERPEINTVRDSSIRAYNVLASTGTPVFTPEPDAHFPALKNTVLPSVDRELS